MSISSTRFLPRTATVASASAAAAALFLAPVGAAGFTTPDTGVEWTMDDLVVHSRGAVAGGDGAYRMLKNVFLAESDRLTIAPGTQLTYPDGPPWAMLVIQGTLVAAGTAEAPIRFTSGAPRGGEGSHDRLLEFHATASPEGVVEHVIFEGSDVGLAAVDAANLVIRHCTVRDCNRGLELVHAVILFDSCTIEGNGPRDRPLNGAGGYVVGGAPVFQSCVIRGNAAGGRRSGGGGLCFRENVDGALLDGCVVTGNRAQFGAGLFMFRANAVEVRGCRIDGNVVDDPTEEWNGPDIQVEDSGGVLIRRNPALGDVSFLRSSGRVTNNFFVGELPALRVHGGSPSILHNAFAGTAATPGLYLGGGGSPRLVNNLFAGLEVNRYSSSAPVFIHNAVLGRLRFREGEGDDAALAFEGVGGLNRLPKSRGNLALPSAADRETASAVVNFAQPRALLPLGSPCRDAGWPAGVTEDFYGASRPQDGDGDGDAAADIGPVEAGAASPPAQGNGHPLSR